MEHAPLVWPCKMAVVTSGCTRRAHIVGVTVHEKQHGWGGKQTGLFWRGETIEFFVVGTAVVALAQPLPVPVPTLVLEVSK